MMKKLTAALAATLALLCAALALASGTPQETAATQTLTAAVLDAQEGFLMLRQSDGTVVQANLDAATVTEADAPFAVGDYVDVQFDGVTTRSIPAQLTAQKVTRHALTGTVTDLSDSGFLLTDESRTDTQVNAEPDKLLGVQDGQRVTVFYNGVATMSLPAQISAEFIRLPAVSGVIDQVDDSGFLMTDDDDTQWQVVVSDDTALYVELAEGATVRVTSLGEATTAVPAQIAAVEVLPYPAP